MLCMGDDVTAPNEKQLILAEHCGCCGSGMLMGNVVL